MKIWRKIPGKIHKKKYEEEITTKEFHGRITLRDIYRKTDGRTYTEKPIRKNTWEDINKRIYRKIYKNGYTGWNTSKNRQSDI